MTPDPSLPNPPSSFVPSPPEPQTQPHPLPTRRLPGWRLWAPLLFQSALIMAIPAQDAYTFVMGRQITLQTVPVDPYDLLRGYSQTLSYDISRPETFKDIPGAKEFFDQYNAGGSSAMHIVLEAPAATTTPPEPWKPVRVSVEPPTDLTASQVVLKGDYNGWQIVYGLETYYMPEDQRNQINRQIGEVQQQDPQAFVVDVKVDARGNSVPVGLWVKDTNYQF